MMKKFAALFLAGVMAASLAACGGSSAAPTASSEAEKVEEAVEETAEEVSAEATAEGGREFIVGFDAEYPPYGYLDMATNDYTGFDLELAQELCNRRGWTTITPDLTLSWLRSSATAAAGHWSRSPSTGTTRMPRSTADPSTASGMA